MTREMLSKKEIKKLSSIDEAIELINLLEYDECLRILNEMQTLPKSLLNAVTNRARVLRGMTLELILASMQNQINWRR